MTNSNRLLITIFFILVSCFFYQIDEKNEVQKTEKLDKKISGIAFVVDGDTIKFGKKRIRLIYIDAPEKRQKCYDKNDKKYACGIKSTEFLKKIAHNRRTECFYKKLDIYKRYLAECFVEGQSINQAMIKNGMAIIYSFQKFDPALKEIQKEAKSNKKGMWQGKFEIPKDYRKRTKKR